MEIAIKKTLKLGFRRRPEHNLSDFSIFLLNRLKSNHVPNISLLDCLIMEIAMKETLKFGF